MQHVTLIGIDTAKNVFHLHAVDKNGKKIYQRKLSRVKLIDFLAQQEACMIAVEACAGSYHWARSFKEIGHSVKIISARRVKSFANTRNKNDFNDALAITKAARDPDTLEIPQKTIAQQEVQAIHILRDGLIQQRTATINRLRSLLTEFGIVIPKGRTKLMKSILGVLDNHSNLTSLIREIALKLHESIKQINQDVAYYDLQIKHCINDLPDAKRLKQIPGVGDIIGSALTFMIADPKVYKNGRSCSASLGLTPREKSTGGKQRLGRISREGSSYLRKILTQGAQAALVRAKFRQDEPLLKWAYDLQQRKGTNIAAIALANKIVRIAWSMLVHQKEFNYKTCS